MPRAHLILFVVILAFLGDGPAAAQQTVAGYTAASDSAERIGSSNHVKLIGHVEIQQGDTKLYADEVEFFEDQNRAIATGNVSFSQGNNNISADRADFDTRTRLGTFYNASGIATLQQQRQRPEPGAVVVPQMTGQVTDVYFFGDVVEKIGPRKYKITNGGFSTCVQPTPRWDLHADTVILNIDHYTLLKQAVLNVKGVPMLYVPFLYYPTKEDGRATGFLLPTYGTSSLRGQSFHNAFFWAINRSQDATIMHDWYSRTGQAFGSEYRYARLTGDGGLRAQIVQDRETTYDNGSVLPASHSYEIRGSATELLSPHLRARANVDYFSSVTTMQTFNTNLYDASRSNRTIGANVVGAWRDYSLNGTYDHTEYFTSTTSSVLTGTSPRITLARNERMLFPGSPLYFGATTEFDRFDRQSQSQSQNQSGDTTARAFSDTGLSRFDIAPQIRYPFKKWEWFTVNSTLLWRETAYTRSLDQSGSIIDQGLNRQFFTLQAQAIGPVFSRIWSTPNNGYAERFKHTIEPIFTVARTSTIDNLDQIVKTDGIDQVVGTTSYSYGVNNRFYAKRKIGLVSQAQEILSVSLAQSYYTNNLASQYDRSYQTSFNTGQQTNFTPIRLDIRGTPTTYFNATVHAEIDSRYHELRSTAVNANYNWSTMIQTSMGWNHTYFIQDLPGFNNAANLVNGLYGSVNGQTRDNRYGVRYSLNYDVQHSEMLQQTLIAFYNAQCCGVAFQYSPRKVATYGANNSFFISFTLAGLGNFSPLNGALTGVTR